MSAEARAHEVAIDYGAFHGEAEIAAMLAYAAEQTAALRGLLADIAACEVEIERPDHVEVTIPRRLWEALTPAVEQARQR